MVDSEVPEYQLSIPEVMKAYVLSSWSLMAKAYKTQAQLAQ
jgi:hypothetical protein